MRRANAEVSDNREFRDSLVLFSIYETPQGITDSVVDCLQKYRYVRLNASTYQHANFALVEFYGKKERYSPEVKLEGGIIGYPPVLQEDRHPYTYAMDGNLETWFEKPRNEVGWVGLDLGEGNEHLITRVRFCPRSDTNFVVPGDLYELCYWHQGEWKSMGKRIADDYSIVYEGGPSGALYLLHNHTRGVEERIFSYEGDRQVWW